jgi:transposase
LEKKPGRKGIYSQSYLEQVLKAVIFPLFETLDREQCIFIEDGSKVHKGKARLLKLNAGIRGFYWPPSSLDLNPIEKVWWWMKEELKKLP